MVGFVCHLLTRNGVLAIGSAISPYRAIRDEVRAQIGHFVEVYVRRPLGTLIERDVKGLYKKALAGESENFTGISDPYEEPLNPELIADTETPAQSVTRIISRLEELGYIPRREVQEVYSADEEKQVEERLRALGYI